MFYLKTERNFYPAFRHEDGRRAEKWQATAVPYSSAYVNSTVRYVVEQFRLRNNAVHLRMEQFRQRNSIQIYQMKQFRLRNSTIYVIMQQFRSRYKCAR